MLEHIGRYIFKERIGVGGQATVYLANDPELNRDVAVKVMHQVASEESAYLEALREEARLAGTTDTCSAERQMAMCSRHSRPR